MIDYTPGALRFLLKDKIQRHGRPDAREYMADQLGISFNTMECYTKSRGVVSHREMPHDLWAQALAVADQYAKYQPRITAAECGDKIAQHINSLRGKRASSQRAKANTPHPHQPSL